MNRKNWRVYERGVLSEVVFTLGLALIGLILSLLC